MRKWAIAPSVVLVALLVSCSSQPAPPTPGPAPASAAAPAPTSAQVATTPSVPPELAAELGPRVELPGGLLRKEIGKTA
jgi:hypothetical protein